MASTGVSRIEDVDPFVAFKAPCDVATTANIALSGPQTIDGVDVLETTPFTRVLVKDQLDPTENGIYVVRNTAWERARDFNGNRDAKKSTLIPVSGGTLYSETVWRLSSSNPIVIGTTSITFEVYVQPTPPDSGDFNRYDSVASFIATTPSENMIYIASYYGGWSEDASVPDAGFYAKKTGGTNTSPTVGSPTVVSSEGIGTQTGYFWDASGIEWQRLNTRFPGPQGTKFGGQLEVLREYLSDPFVQYFGIVFMGDSITWGYTLDENNTGTSTTLLDTVRDNFASRSFVNEFKRYIGKEYFDDAAPVLSNWSASTGGEAIAEYTTDILTYPNRDPFSTNETGSVTFSDTATENSVTGYQAVMAVSSGGGNVLDIKWNMTGNSFSLVFTCVDSDAASYELLVDGVSQGSFDTSTSGGFVDGSFGNEISHTFSFVDNKEIIVRIDGASYPSIRRLRVEAIKIPKTVRITNQAIAGTNSTRYYSRALTTAFLPDIAYTDEDFFAFVMLGTNDRLDSTWPNAINSFKSQMEVIFDLLDSTNRINTVVMCANAVSPTNQAGKRLTMQNIRTALVQIAKNRPYDFIDNLTLFSESHPDSVLDDGLHPNVAGHNLIFRNIVGNLES